MPSQASESLILRTYALKESDLIVSFFTRDQGKLRGVARGVRKPKSKFGAGLERLSHSRLYYSGKEGVELLFITGCDLLGSPFAIGSRYEASVVLDYIAEVSDLLLPAAEENERFFRLILAMLDYLRADGSPWCAATYFSLWAVQLSGILGQPIVSSESRAIAQEMFATPIAGLSPRDWNKFTARDLRRAMLRDIEQHAERRVQSASILEAL